MPFDTCTELVYVLYEIAMREHGRTIVDYRERRHMVSIDGEEQA